MSKLIRFSALLAVIVAGIGAHQQIGSAASTQVDDAALIRLARASMVHENVGLAARSLSRKIGVRSARAVGNALTVRLTDGTFVRVDEGARGMLLRLPAAGAESPRQLAPGTAGRAVVLEPFAWQFGTGPNTGTPNLEIQRLQQAGFQVDAKYNEEVTVNFMAGLTQYNVVYMETHSGTNPGGDGIVATGEQVGTSTAPQQFLQDGSVDPVKISTPNGESTQQYYGITSAFITNHLGRFPSHAMFFINGCSMLQAPRFWQALQTKGVATLVSWDKEATIFDNYLAGAAFFNVMDQGQTVSSAIKTIQDAGYGKSNSNNVQATLGFLGDGTLTLQQAASGQVQAPTPVIATATSAVPNATSTPAPSPTAIPPTATPTLPPGPEVTVQLKRRVNPGARQVINVTSKPNSIIHLHVVFPNGDKHTATTATDGRGKAHFSFVQQPNEITFGHLSAKVTVDAVNGGTSTWVSNYRIGYAPVDLNVDPAVQQVGRMVRIWVHSQPHIKVRVTLRFPTGASLKLHGSTGKGGWSDIKYKVGSGLKHGANRLVSVSVEVLTGASTLHADGAFQIK